MPPKRVFKPIRPNNNNTTAPTPAPENHHQNEQPTPPILLEELESLLNQSATNPPEQHLDTKPDISQINHQKNISQPKPAPLFKPSSPEPAIPPQKKNPQPPNNHQQQQHPKKSSHTHKKTHQHQSNVDNELWLSKNLTDPVKTVEVRIPQKQ
jgi:ABC-type Zn2+ transport system substrate-binding protein/surface adhesin